MVWLNAHRGGTGYMRATKTHVEDTTGAGDAFSGAVIFGIVNDVPIDEAMRLGITGCVTDVTKPRDCFAKLNARFALRRACRVGWVTF